VSEGWKISRRMASRLSDAYIVASEQFLGHGASFWAHNDERNSDLISALRIGDIDKISVIANDPGRQNFFWGIDGLAKEYTQPTDHSTSNQPLLVEFIVRLAEAVGAQPLWYPEAHGDRRDKIAVDKTLDVIEHSIGTKIDFPNPFPREIGIRTSRGIASYRTFQSIYQAWRLRILTRMVGARILEIGPGLGRTVYYARNCGLSNYTTIDLPLGNIAQGCFLSHVLGEDAITLPGEPAQIGRVRIETPSWYMATTERFDVVLNADSLTEMAFDHANAYAKRIVETARAFVSINHEINSFRVADLPALKGLTDLRFPYWMREGYVEDLYLIS